MNPGKTSAIPVSASHYRDRDGKGQIVTGTSKKQAGAKWAGIKVEIGKGVHTPSSASPTMAEAAQLWLDRCEARGLQRATLAGYEEHVRRHINPYLGKLKLANLTPASIRKECREFAAG